MDMKNCTAGFARLDITPPMGVPLGGSWQARNAKGVHDPLMVNAVAFGDAQNDIPMLRAAGTGVAMGNATEAVKAAADEVTHSNNEDGIATWLEKYL